MKPYTRFAPEFPIKSSMNQDAFNPSYPETTRTPGYEPHDLKYKGKK
jgi:hypothetical protein